MFFFKKSNSEKTVSKEIYDSLYAKYANLKNKMDAEEVIKNHSKPILISIDNIESISRSTDGLDNGITVIKYRTDQSYNPQRILYISDDRHANLVNRITRNDNPNVHTVRV